ncbi:MAG: hypothetical protein AAGE84_16090, partial [Cyanobacteria bacterium P01_G01_bin.39]
ELLVVTLWSVILPKCSSIASLKDSLVMGTNILSSHVSLYSFDAITLHSYQVLVQFFEQL